MSTTEECFTKIAFKEEDGKERGEQELDDTIGAEMYEVHLQGWDKVSTGLEGQRFEEPVFLATI